MKTKVRHEFVKTIPSTLSENTVYVSIDFGTAVHKCICGCDNKVVTPLTPTDWKLIYDGRNISLYPSIGNWNLKCQSHYWIENDEVIWCKKWSKKEISQANKRDLELKRDFYSENISNIQTDKANLPDAPLSFKNWIKKLLD